jgi:hypothetical protein
MKITSKGPLSRMRKPYEEKLREKRNAAAVAANASLGRSRRPVR